MQKIILITGGSSGLGLALAKKLSLNQNNEIVICSCEKEELDYAKKEILEFSKNKNCEAYICDITKEKEIKSLIDKVVKKFGRIDCLVNNAGIWIEGKLEENNFERIEKVFAVNVLGAINVTQKVLPFMMKIKSGRILNVISEAGLYAKSERSVYHASKFALRGFTDSLAIEAAKDGIAVSGIYPSKINTPLYIKAGIKRGEKELNSYLSVDDVVRCVEFIIETRENINIQELFIKNLSEY